MRNFQVVNLGRIIFEHGISCTENFGWWDSWRVVGLWSSLGWNVSWRTSLVWVRLHSFCDSWQALFCAATTCFARFVDCLHNYVVSSVGRQTFWAESEDRRICFKLGKSFSSECPPKSAQIFDALYRDLLFLPWNFLKQHIFACTRKHGKWFFRQWTGSVANKSLQDGKAIPRQSGWKSTDEFQFTEEYCKQI